MDEPPRSRAPIVIAVVVGVILIVALRSFLADRGSSSPRQPGGPSTPAPSDANGPCVGITVAASSEKAALLGEIARAYQRTGPRAADRCVRVNVVSKSSGGATDALARGWNESLDGPRPDVWSPAATSWVNILRQRTAAADRPDLVPTGDLPTVAQTPLVIAMPRPMAGAMGWPGKAIGWSDILSLARDPAGWGKFGHPEWGAFRLGKTNPNFSTSGLHATIASFFAATGRSSDLTEADLRDAKVLEFVRGVETSVVHYGDITLTFLSNLQQADDAGQGLSYISAVTVEEKSVWDYNQGNPTGDPATLGKHPKPRTPLVAIYPKEGTLVSDSPYVILNASWVDDAKREAATGFLAFLQRADQQRRFQSAAFRDFRGRPGSVISAANGLSPDQPDRVITPPAPAVLDGIERSWAEVRKRARVLLVIDVSGSMGNQVSGTSSTKLDLAKRAAIRALGQFAPDDQVGLWVFSSDFPPDGAPILQLEPVGPVGPKLAEMRRRIDNLQPFESTALYVTIREASNRMRSSFDPQRINAVVLLTDGINDYQDPLTLAGLVRQLRSEGEERAVRVFPIAYGGDADLRTLQAVATASRGAAYDASDPESIDKVFTAVISNF